MWCPWRGRGGTTVRGAGPASLPTAAHGAGFPPASLAAQPLSGAPTPPPGETGNARGHCTVTAPPPHPRPATPRPRSKPSSQPLPGAGKELGVRWWGGGGGGGGKGTPPGVTGKCRAFLQRARTWALCFPQLRSRAQGPTLQGAHSSSLELRAAPPRPARPRSISVLTAGLTPQHPQAQVT